MAAGKLNYVVVYDGLSQVFGCASKKIALESAPPEGYSLKDKKILFVTFEPDSQNLCVYQVAEEEVQTAEIKKKKQNDD
jgi:hypothetical protein